MAPEVVLPLEPLVLDEREYPLQVSAAADPAPDGRWIVWLEFADPQTGATRTTAVETVAASPVEARDWAHGLSARYLQDALQRAVPTADPLDNVAADVDLAARIARGVPVLHHALQALSRPALLGIVDAEGLNPGRLPLTLLDQPQLVTFVSTAVQLRHVRKGDPIL